MKVEQALKVYYYVFKGKSDGYCRICSTFTTLNSTGYCEACYATHARKNSNNSTLKSDAKRFLTDAGIMSAYEKAVGADDKANILDRIIMLFVK
jgi:calcineurin-like phosphoesterase